MQRNAKIGLFTKPSKKGKIMSYARGKTFEEIQIGDRDSLKKLDKTGPQGPWVYLSDLRTVNIERPTSNIESIGATRVAFHKIV